MIDVDHFKKVNDTHGHAAGDEVLTRLSQILSEAARPVDVAARYGGEEFALILVETDKEAARAKADEIRQRFARQEFEAGGVKFSVTMSVGVSTCTDDATTSAQLLRSADERLYKAKTGGRNRVVDEGDSRV
jgi:diguanylate cyclase (GGDEF)-like protein